MARILVCHVPKDGSIARDLGAALMGRGHYVSFDGEPDAPRPDRLSRLRQFEAVMVVWTESSYSSPGLADIARESLPLNLLVPVRAEELAITRLPLMFRKLNMLPPRDMDAIARVIARLSTAASSLRDMAEGEAQRKANQAEQQAQPRGAQPRGAQPNGARPQQPQDRKPERPASLERPTSQGRPTSPERQTSPERKSQPSPVVETAGAVRVRPLAGLPEVSVEPVLPDPRREDRAVPPQARPSPASLSPERPSPDKNARASSYDRPAVRAVTADDLARAVEAGLLIHHIPQAMWLGDPVTVELTLGREILASLTQPEGGYGGSAIDDRHGVETLSISLYGSSHAFEIERQSERTQFVSRHAMPTRDPVTFGRWAWLVTPRASGSQDLVVRISALLRDHHGVPGPVALPDRRFAIDVQVPEGASLISALAGWRLR